MKTLFGKLNIKDYLFIGGAILLFLIVVTALRSYKGKNVPLEQSNGSYSSFEEQNNSVSEEKKLHSRSKYRKIVEDIGFSEKESSYMYMFATNQKNPNWFMEISSSIAFHETKGGTLGVATKGRNNIYGMMQYVIINGERKQIPMVFKNRMASFEDFAERYSKHWYNNDCNKMITKSVYTTTEVGPWLTSCAQIQGKFYE